MVLSRSRIENKSLSELFYHAVERLMRCENSFNFGFVDEFLHLTDHPQDSVGSCVFFLVKGIFQFNQVIVNGIEFALNFSFAFKNHGRVE